MASDDPDINNMISRYTQFSEALRATVLERMEEVFKKEQLNRKAYKVLKEESTPSASP